MNELTLVRNSMDVGNVWKHSDIPVSLKDMKELRGERHPV
jgi:hypothetical protein